MPTYTAPTRDTTLLHEALVATALQHAQPHELPALIDELRSLVETEQRLRERLRAASHPPRSRRCGVPGAC